MVTHEAAKAAIKDLRGVKVSRDKGGRLRFTSEITVKGQYIYLGSYNDPKIAAKAYDMHVLRNNLGRKTNFIKPLKDS